MADISKCNWEWCTIRHKCYRFTARANKFRQSYTKWECINWNCDLFYSIKCNDITINDIKKARERLNYVCRWKPFWDPFILKNHDTNKSLWTWNCFKFEWKKYAIEPWYIRHKDWSVELLEISFVSLEKSWIVKRIKK